MTDHDGLFLTQRFDQSDDIGHQRPDAVGVAAPELRGAPIAALIDRHRTVTMARQKTQLMTPRVPQFRKAVQQHHQWPMTGFDVMQPRVVDGRITVLESVHRAHPLVLNIIGR